MIDWPLVTTEYHHILHELSAINALDEWSIKPQGLIKTNHKTKYGMADSSGFVHINQAFIGTTSYQLLQATLRHEFAHLCVGLEQKHNARFKTKERQFKANFRTIERSEHQQVLQNIGFKYQLYASLKSGETVLLKQVQRKHQKYTHYKPTLFRYLTIKGQKVLSFHYVERN